jgi:hypothetical protein
MLIDCGMRKIILSNIKSADGEKAVIDNILVYARGRWSMCTFSPSIVEAREVIEK